MRAISLIDVEPVVEGARSAFEETTDQRDHLQVC
jgi:hypothetical protein